MKKIVLIFIVCTILSGCANKTVAFDNTEQVTSDTSATLYPVNSNGQTYGSSADADDEHGYPDLVLAQGDDGTEGYITLADFWGFNADEYEHYEKVITDEVWIEYYRNRFRNDYDNYKELNFYQICYDMPLYDETGENVIGKFVRTLETIPYTENITVKENKTSSNDNIEKSDSFIYLSESGIYTLVQQDIIWRHYLYGNYSFEQNYEPKTFKSDDNTYIELAITNHNDIENIQNAFHVKLEQSPDESHYGCPFNSIPDLKKHMQETYTDEQVDYILSYMPMIEHEGSLYITDSGGVFSDRKPIDITITEKDNTNVKFSIKYDLFIDDLDFTTNYHAIYKNDKWLLSNIDNDVL